MLLLLLLCSAAAALTNNADLIFYEKGSAEPLHYRARDKIPPELLRAQKIVVNEPFPVLWEVKFTSFPQLDTLIIDNCSVEEVRADTFKQLKPLLNLSIARNLIREIKSGVFNVVPITNLDLSHNLIAIVASDAFDAMPALETIRLDFNELKQWDANWFLNSSNIRVVSMTHNFVEELPPNAFRNLVYKADKPSSLYFSYNKIRRIDQATFGGELLADLFLDANDLNRISGRAIGRVDRIGYLNLNGNGLVCLSDEFINGMGKMGRISVEGNAIECHCLRELANRAGNVTVVISKQQIEAC